MCSTLFVASALPSQGPFDDYVYFFSYARLPSSAGRFPGTGSRKLHWSFFETLILPAEVAAVEKLATSRTEADRKERRLDVIALRLVGYFLIHSDLFSHEARGAMERAIASCNVESNEASSHIKLSELGKFYLNHLI